MKFFLLSISGEFIIDTRTDSPRGSQLSPKVYIHSHLRLADAIFASKIQTNLELSFCGEKSDVLYLMFEVPKSREQFKGRNQ